MTTAREYETAAITRIHESIQALEGARGAAEHGGYRDAAQSVAEVRAWLRDAEVELLRAAEETP